MASAVRHGFPHADHLLAEAPDLTLAHLIDRIAERCDNGEGISVGTIQEVAGKRFAGPLLFFPAMIVVSPLSLVPTLPTMVAITVVLIAVQLLAGRRTIWLPRKFREAKLSAERVQKVISFMRPGVRWVDKVIKPRLAWLVDSVGVRLASMVCILVAVTMPPLEFFPGASTMAGVIMATLGLAITVRDGALLVAALALFGGAVFFISRLFM